MQVAPAKDILERSRSDRRTTRANAYRRFLEGAVSHSVDLGGVQFSAPRHFPPITVRNRGELRNLLVGILREDGYLNEIGILTDIESNALQVYTRAVEIRRMELGHVKLSTSGREIGFL
jgi:polynucleotide 5'-kinase involved in rRNA processing